MTKYWFDNCPVRTFFHDGISVVFPAWETAFSKIAAAYKPSIQDPALLRRMDEFIAQETAHGNAHHAHNVRVGSTSLEAAEFAKIALVIRKPRMKLWLAAMVSIEHLAAHLARSFLATHGSQKGREFALFRWHAVEELQHKSLAIDLWDALGYSRIELASLARRNLTYMVHFVVRYVWGRLREEHVKLTPSVLYRLGLGVYALWQVRKVFHELQDPTFHPNHIDDSILIGRFA
jgi:predicted metal-dependent hydrolase